MARRGFWVALAIILFYLIARPHIATVWDLRVKEGVLLAPPTCGPHSETPPPGITRMSECSDQMLGIIPTPSPYPSPHVTRYYSWRDCFANLVNMVYVSRYNCVVGTEFLWGW